MLTVVIETLDDEEGLARTLASLVPGAIGGIVREVIVCDRGSRDSTCAVAEHAGCRFLAQGSFVDAVARARGEWLLLMEPGARLAEGWMEPVAAHTAARTEAARFTQSAGSARQGPFARLLRGRRRLAAGLLVGKTQAFAKKAENGEALARLLSPRRLGAGIIAAPAKKRK